VVILFDRSGNFDSQAKRKTQQMIVGKLVRSTPSSTRFALVGFGSRVLETVEFDRRRSDILSAVVRLPASPGEGKTAVRDAQ
jgi:hypothetical protein